MSGVPISIPPRSGRTNSDSSFSQQRNSIKQNTLHKINKQQQKKIVRHSRTGSNNSLSPTSQGIKTNDSNNSLPPSPTSTTLLENVISLMQFPDYRNKVICPTCNSTGTIINKNGTTSRQTTDPRPDQQFKCNNCKKFVTITQLRSLISTAIGTSSITLPNTTDNNNNNNDYYNNTNGNNNNKSDSIMELDNTSSSSSSPQQQQHSTNDFLLNKLSILEQRLDSFQVIIDENISMKAEKIKRLTLIIESMQQKPADLIDNVQKQTTKKSQKSASIYNNNNNNNEEDVGDTHMSHAGEASSSGNTQLIDYDQNFPLILPQQQQQQQQNTKKKSIKNHRSYKPTEKDLVVAQRTFQEKKEHEISNFIYTYVPVHRRFRSSELRKKLSLLGLDNVQILDAYCPDWKVAAILTHEKYQPQLIEAFSKAKILTSFYNHLDPIHIRDPKHQHLTTEQKLDLSKTIQNNNMMRALKHMRFTAKYSVARSFFRDGLITLTQLQDTLKSRYISDATGFCYFASVMEP